MNQDSRRQLVNLLAVLITIGINVLANALPLNGQNTGAISDRFRVYFVPAGYVFAIWGLIYLGWLAFAVFQALPSGSTELAEVQRQNPRLRRLGYLFALSCLANIAWLFCWHYNQFGLSVAVMLTLLGLLIASYLRLEVGLGTTGRLEKWMVQVPFSIYLGWISVATIANISDYLYYVGWDGWGLDPQLWAALMLAVGVLLVAAMLFTRNDGAFALVALWAFLGIFVKQLSHGLAAYAALLAAAAVLALLLARLVVRRKASAAGG